MQPVEEQVNIRVLGPFRVHLREQKVTPTAAKQRQILALLALNAGRVVTVPTLLEEIWGDDPPSSSRATLQTYISQMRNRFATALPRGYDTREVISTHHGGYLLRSDWFQTDVAEFKRIARMGRAAAERRDYREASETLTKALELWQGPVLSDVPCGRILELEAMSLEEKRLSALERRIESDLALQRHADVLGDLRLLITKHPTNENLSGFFMIALYRSGNVGRALEEFRRLRTVMRSELGINPSPKLERLQQSVLARDPSLESTSNVAASVGAAHGKPPRAAFLFKPKLPQLLTRHYWRHPPHVRRQLAGRLPRNPVRPAKYLSWSSYMARWLPSGQCR